MDAKNQKIQYTYDSYNRVTQVQHFVWQFSYQCGCNTYVEDTSQQVLSSYDTNPYDGGAYSHNTQGRLTAIAYQPMSNTFVQPMFQEWYSYSVPGSVTGKQMTVSQYNAPQGYNPFKAQVALSSTYAYDNEGKMTSVTYPSVSNHSAAYTTSFDAMARPTSMSDGTSTVVSGLSYGPANEMPGINYFGYSETRSYNSRLQLTSINALRYIYPANGANNGKAVEQKVTSGEDVVCSYDALNRLILAQTTGTSSTSWGQGFSYDGFGNLYQKTGTGTAPSQTIGVDPATNRTSLAGYDANGNVLSSGTANLTYDVENRNVSVNGGTTGYAYDSGNRRVWKGTYNASGGLLSQEAYFYGVNGQRLGTYDLVLVNPPPYTKLCDRDGYPGVFWREASGACQREFDDCVFVKPGSVWFGRKLLPVWGGQGNAAVERSDEVCDLYEGFGDGAGLCDEPVLLEWVGEVWESGPVSGEWRTCNSG